MPEETLLCIFYIYKADNHLVNTLNGFSYHFVSIRYDFFLLPMQATL
jgi:hypothetical protein